MSESAASQPPAAKEAAASPAPDAILTDADQTLPSHEDRDQEDARQRWLKTREDDGADIPSEAPTPAPAEVPDTPQPGSDGSGTPVTKTTHIDAEDEDVKIAIMALGAMRHLDGQPRAVPEVSSGRALGDEAGTSRATPKDPHALHASLMDSSTRRERDGSNTSMAGTSSILSTSSVTSTAVSSPSSTPATEWTAASASACSVGSLAQHAESSSAAASRGSSRAATLADLPSDFDFPAIIRDEDGNEVEVDREMMRDEDFLARVSHLPIVRGTLKAYELGKQKSKIVKYGGDLVESSVKAISRPVVGRLGASLGDKGKEQLDDFACRQLDRIYPGSASALPREERARIAAELDERERTEWAHMDAEERAKRRRAYWALNVEEREREMVVNELRQRRKGKGTPSAASTAPDPASPSTRESASSSPHTVTPTPQDSSDVARTATDPAQSGAALVKQVTKSGSGGLWSSMLVEAGATAGGLSAAMSEESMKSLKYCLQWLQYATAHIEHQITVLRDLIVKLNHGELELTSPAAQNLTQIKGDVVNTIRSVVDVVGKYAGGALPEPARVSVKAFILSLPARWATVNRAPALTNTSSFGGSPASPSFSPAHLGGSSSASSPPSSSGATAAMTAAATAQAANRVLTLAVESLDILRSVTVVVGESLDRADLWVERLRMLGIQRKRQHEQEAIGAAAPPSSSGGIGRVEAPPHWESARGLASHRRGSIGAGSDVSMGTSASTKRRRMRSDGPDGHMHGHGHGYGDEDHRPHHQSHLAGSPVAGSGSNGTMTTSVSYGRMGANGSGAQGSHSAGGLGGTGAGAGAGSASRRRRGAAMTPTFSSGS
ncbi:unnamed protein product [Parajaminaea phylloscopi]